MISSFLAIIKRNTVAVSFSVALHFVLIVFVIVGLDQTTKPKALKVKPNIVNAVAVNASKVDAELKKLQRADENRKSKEKKRVAKLKRQERDAKKKRIAEEKKLAKAKKKRLAEEKKSKVAEKKRKQVEKKRKQEQKKLAKAKADQKALAKKQKAEKKRLAKVAAKKKAAKLKADKERKRKLAEQKKKEQQRKQALAKQLEAEETARNSALAKTEIEKYLVLIKQKVDRRWLKPSGSIKGLVCKVRVRIIPGGDVVSVKVIRGSGNNIFDRSVERAVRKASPLPLPKDPAIAARMREIDFNFSPEA